MNARKTLRAPRRLRLDDAGAGATPLRSARDRARLSKSEIKQREREATAALAGEIAACQEMLYARRTHKVLLVLQGMDTSGKDGTVRALFSRINPMGLRAVSFKAPSDEEKAHDFLWRVHRQVPASGEIALFNRSHYEDVLVPLVQGSIDQQECKRRYAQIRDFERLLAESGTVIIKLFLHISKDEQRARLQERIDDPHKHWKFDRNDVVQRGHWEQYQRAYEQAILATDADHAPWYIIPADSKTHRNLLISTLLQQVFKDLDLAYPPPDPALAGLVIE